MNVVDGETILFLTNPKHENNVAGDKFILLDVIL